MITRGLAHDVKWNSSKGNRHLHCRNVKPFAKLPGSKHLSHRNLHKYRNFELRFNSPDNGQRVSRSSPKSARDPLDSPASQGKFARFRPAEQFRIPGLEIVWGPSRSAGAKQKAVKSSTFCQPLVLLRNSSGGDNVCVMVGSGERVDSISENGRIQT
eukprot:213082_1